MILDQRGTGVLRALVAILVLGAAGLVFASVRGDGGSATAATAATQKRPNVIVIETDDQTADSLRFMPNVRRLLAAQGTTFDNSFASFPLCCPSRATLLTGQYAHNHGVMGNSPPQGGYEKLDHSNTLAVWLRRAGYYTAHVGKYLNGYGSPQNEREIPAGWREWHGATKLPFLGFTVNEGGQLRTYPADQANYQTDVWSRKGVDVIRRRAPSTQPFFMWFAVYAPHAGGPRDPDDPVLRAGPGGNQPGGRRERRRQRRQLGVFGGPSPAARHRDRFVNEALPQPPSFNEADVSDKPAAIRNRNPLGPQQVTALREMYQQRLESLLAVDEAVAALVQALRARGELSRTLIIFTSDNGFMHGEHRIPSGKNVVYEPSVRVPLVLRGPGIARNRHVRTLVANIDLAPTIVAAAKARAGRRMDGINLAPLTKRRSARSRDILLETPSYSAIRTTRYVYAEHATGERELYDLATDPHQLTSRHADPALARVRADLARRLARLKRCSGAACR